MQILKHRDDLGLYLNQLRNSRQSIGFVPTMGALHEGHLSLIRQSRKECEKTVCSIFVNPSQFDQAADLAAYPVTTAADIELLLSENCDVLFLPDANEMYPNGPEPNDHYDFGFLSATLEGEHRPGHYNGMAQIVEKLLRAVMPDKLFMGQKDYQQLMIVRELVDRVGLPVEVIMSPTVREADGLAMSSRNRRMSESERRDALGLYRSLKWVEEQLGRIPVAELEEGAAERLKQIPGIRGIDYIALRNADTLETVSGDKLPERLVVLAAIHMPSTRLIDNLVIEKSRQNS